MEYEMLLGGYYEEYMATLTLLLCITLLGSLVSRHAMLYIICSLLLFGLGVSSLVVGVRSLV